VAKQNIGKKQTEVHYDQISKAVELQVGNLVMLKKEPWTVHLRDIHIGKTLERQPLV